MNFPPFTNMPLPAASTGFEARIATGSANNLITSGDVVRSVEARPNRYQAGDFTGGDLRLHCALPVVPENFFAPHIAYNTAGMRMAHSLRSEENAYQSNNGAAVTLIPGVGYNRQPAAARGTTEARNVSGSGDFDNATGDGEDGAYVNKADEGNLATGDGGYFSRGSFNVENGETFSPNRQISSAVSFGSLPTGVKRSEYAAFSNNASLARPWQTLLFTPYPASRNTPNNTTHPGFGESRVASGELRPPYKTPPDHLFLDLFTMPIVEPYAISEPFSTAGKVNLNYQLAPFTHIKRATGLHAVLRSTKVTAIPTGSSDKSGLRRYDINPDVGGGADGGTLEGSRKGTLYGFYKRLYEEGDLFRSASQICDIGLVPGGSGVNADYDSLATFWAQNRRTGDNVREGAYGHIYPRVTTKSNTYTVHMRVQSLRKARNSDADKWVEGRDQVLSEYRGSTSLERYIDAADPELPDFASSSLQAERDNLDRHYRFRIIATKAFNP
ncbi:MAG: Verru_Chthon cassette protein A [Verrucomicrobiaceae bacterium]|nr:MAG: Verru_Chthon cassette protein A [Verrucomicrobiaceae bacterium]